jgi:secreted trypsin-like serine protease
MFRRSPFALLVFLCLVAFAPTLFAQALRPIDRVQDDERPEEMTDKIVGGKPVPPGKYPFQVALIKATTKVGREYFGQFCGGTLIDERWVLTAAHCVPKTKATEIQVYIGSTVLPAGDEELSEGPARLSVSRVVSHHKYDPKTHDNDIALLRLEAPASLKFKSAALGTYSLAAKHARVGSTVVVTGWGRTKEGGTRSATLMEVNVQIRKNTECEAGLRDFVPSATVTANMFCAGRSDRTRKVDACQGDSGGFIGARILPDRYAVFGIVSWGFGCGRPGLSGVYTRVANYQKWIKDITAL